MGMARIAGHSFVGADVCRFLVPGSELLQRYPGRLHRVTMCTTSSSVVPMNCR